MKLRAYLLMLFTVAVWGSTFVLIKAALADASPAAFNLARMTLAFLVLAIAYHRSWRGIRPWHIAAGALVGLCLAAGYQFQTIGLVYTTPSKSAFITGLVVVLVPLLSSVPGLRPPGAQLAPLERLPRRRARLPRHPLPHRARQRPRSGARRSCPTSPPSTSATSSPSAAPSASPSTASPSPTSRRASTSARSLSFRWAGAPSSWPSACASSNALTSCGPRASSSLSAIAAVLATAAAFSIQSWAQSILPPTHTALILAMEPVFAWITSFLVLSERLALRPAAGALLILGGIALTELIRPPQQVPTAHEA